jgi:hypothetical protein
MMMMMMQSLEYVLTSKVWFLESVLTCGDGLIKFTSSWVQMLAHDVFFLCNSVLARNLQLFMIEIASKYDVECMSGRWRGGIWQAT